MAEINILLQGLEKGDDHDTAVNNLLKIPDIDHYLLSLAFARSTGVDRIKRNLQKVSGKTRVFIGIRNGITSIQSIFSLFKIGICPYVVDTATNTKIFHPKIYSAYNTDIAHVILGSANLTFGGLNKNIEASSQISLDLNLKKDKEYILKLVDIFADLPVKFPDHIFQVTTPRQAVGLLNEGRLEDERKVRLPVVTPQKNKKRDKLQPISTYVKGSPKPHKGARKTIPKKKTNTATLVWESKPLTERSLNIPKGANTNITGDTNLGLGLMEDVDFQHYFRENVFTGVVWATNQNSRSPYLERATIKTEIVIKNTSYGIFDLEVTHDPRTNTRSYQQRNVMTKIKWGPARSLIAKRDLLGRTLRLYRKDLSSFTIVID